MKKRIQLVLCALCILAAAGSTASADVNRGGILKWHLQNNPPALDPVTSNITTSARGMNLYLETLVKNGADGEILPLLAEKWEVNSDSTVWTFHLRKGVTFHKTVKGAATLNGGREMTADDVKYSLERLVKMKSARVMFISTIRGYKDLFDGKADSWTGIEVVDKYTVRFTLEMPYAPFLAALTYTSFGVVPKEDAEKLGKDFNFSPVGTGPFAFHEWKQDNVVSFRKNPGYWRKDAAGGQLPYLDGVDLVVMPDYSVAYMELKKGNLHVLEEVTDEYYTDAKKEFGAGYQERPALQNYYYGLSQIREPFKDNLKLRQAINYAVDRKAISEMLLNGRYMPAMGVLPPGMSSYDPNLRGYAYNPEKAKQLLKEAGFEKGIEITLHYNSTPRHKAIAEAVQAQLGQFNITVNLASTEVGAHYDAVRRGDYEFFRAGWAGDYNDPDNFLYTLFCSDNFGAKGNYCRYKNDMVDTLLRDARKEPDPAKRVEMYKKAEQQIVDDAVWLFLYYQTTSFVSRPEVRNIKLPFLGAYMTDLSEVSLSK